MSPRTPHDGGDPSPCATPVPAGECPKCGCFMWVRLTMQPTLAIAKPAGPGDPCTICPHCDEPLWVILTARPALARPSERALTALIPKVKTAQFAPTEIIHP